MRHGRNERSVLSQVEPHPYVLATWPATRAPAARSTLTICVWITSVPSLQGPLCHQTIQGIWLMSPYRAGYIWASLPYILAGRMIELYQAHKCIW